MKVTVSKSKNTTIFYLTKSVWVDGRSTSKTVEKIGSLEEVREKAGGMDPYEWCKQYAARRTLEEKQEQLEHVIRLSASKRIPAAEQVRFNAGYLFLQDIYYELGLDRICKEIAGQNSFSYDLNAILSRLIYTRILYPSSKRASLELSRRFLETPDFELHDVYRALEVLAASGDFIQSQVYRNSQKILPRRDKILYYDCTNYYFEIEEEDSFRRYGVSKEHRPNPIVQMGLFMDADGIPLAFSIFPGNENEQPSLKPLEEQLLKDFGLEKFIVCTDAGLASMANRRFNNIRNRAFVTTQSIKTLKQHLQDYCLSPDGWHLPGDKRTYSLTELDAGEYRDAIFYKDRWINENDMEQHLVVSFSFKHREYQRSVRNRQIIRAAEAVASPSKTKPKQNDYKRFIHDEHCTNDGEVAGRTIRSLDQDRIEEEEKYDGFYAVCTNLEDSPEEIIALNHRRWKIEECFRIMKTEFKARPVFLSREDRIRAHFLTCYLALVIFRLLEKKTDGRFTCDELIRTMQNMDLCLFPGEGYVPAYTPDDVSDALHKAFGFYTDYQIIPQKTMKKILTKTKK